MTSFEKVKELVDDGKLKLITVIAPARTGSTFIEIALTESPSVDAHCNQPFHWPEDWPDFVDNLPSAEDREEQAYKSILETYEKVESDEPVTIVTKIMIKNLGFDEQFERLQEVTDKTIFLTRNAHLSVSSLMSAHLPFLRDHHENQVVDIEDHAIGKGFADYDEMETYVKETKDYSVMEEITLLSHPYSDVNNHLDYKKEEYLRSLDDDIIKKFGYRDLDHYARSNDGRDWDSLLGQALDGDEQSFDSFDELFDEIRKTSWTGWTAMEIAERKYMAQSDDYIVVDSTILRADPVRVLEQLTAFAGIEMSGDMADSWSKAAGKDFDKGGSSEWFSKTYSGALSGTSIRLPAEIPIEPEKLPKQFREHMLDTALPTYVKMLANDQMIKPSGREEIETLLDIEVDNDTKLRDVDPIFAYALIVTDQSLGDLEKASMLTDIVTEHGDKYQPIFSKIDNVVTEIEAEKLTKQHGSDTGRVR